MPKNYDSPWEMDLEEAVRYLRTRLSEKENEESVDTGFRTRLWNLVRSLRGHPSLRNLGAREALEAIRGAVKRWCPDDQDPWFDYLKFTEDDEVEFLTSWVAVKYPPGVDLLNEAVERAKAKPLVPEGYGTKPDSKYGFFLSIAGHLQNILGPEVNILLPCKKLAEFVEVDPSMISRYRRLAKIDGYLEEMVHYHWSSSGKGKATEFQFDIDRFPELQEPIRTIDTEEQSKEDSRADSEDDSLKADEEEF